MKIAVTNHAVIRYKERVPGADVLEDESVRDVVREKIENGFTEGLVRYHPTVRERRIIPFKAGEQMLYFSIGPNKASSTYFAHLAVIGVLYDRELSDGKVGMGVTIEDANAELRDLIIAQQGPPQFILQVGNSDSIEVYRAKETQELKALLLRRRPDVGQVLVYELSDIEILSDYSVRRGKK